MARRGVTLTYLAFVARASVEALEEFPVLNASIEGDELVHHEDVNLGIAVALDDGLIVPVIRRRSGSSLEGLAAAIADVAERARERRLEPDDVHGGTFTITNPGQFGAVLATPIINQPQVAILDLEAIVKRPVVVEGADGERLDRDPADGLPLHVLGPPGARRRGGGALPRRDQGRLEEWEADEREYRHVPIDHEELVVRRGRAQRRCDGRRRPLDRARPGARRCPHVALRAPRTASPTPCAWPAG